MGTTQNPECHTNLGLEYSDTPLPQVTTTYQGIKTTNPYPKQNPHPDINVLETLANPSTTMTTPISIDGI